MNQLKRIMHSLDMNGQENHYKMKTILFTLALFLSSCYGTYYLTDAEYSDVRESHASLTYYNNQIYWGWNSGYYYYYGIPHYYPWN